MNMEIKFYNDKVALNVLTNSLENAKALYDATEGHVLLGILSADYPDVPSAIADMRLYQEVVDNAISVGLGAGNPNQWRAVAEISQALLPQHANQVFPAVGYTRALVNNDTTYINALVSPTGTPGMVKITTGPESSKREDGFISIEATITLIKEMGGSSIKFFPMKGLTTQDEYVAVAKACAAANFALEPTGGIDLENFSDILKMAVDAGVPKIIPHVYSSIIDKESGATRVGDVQKLYAMMQEIVK